MGAGTTTASNPLAIIPAVDDRLLQFQTRASVGLSYEVIPDLTFKTFGGAYVNIFNRDFYRANSLLFREATEGESYAQASSSTEIKGVAEKPEHVLPILVDVDLKIPVDNKQTSWPGFNSLKPASSDSESSVIIDNTLLSSLK